MKTRILKFLIFGSIFLLALPFVLWFSYGAYLELSEKTIHVHAFPAGDIIKVTKKIDGGFTGSGYWYSVLYKTKDDDNFQFITGSDRLWDQDKFNVYDYSGMIIMLTSIRDQISIKRPNDNWIGINLRDKIVMLAQNHQEIKLVENTSPLVKWLSFDVATGNLLLEMYGSASLDYVQNITLKISSDDNKIDIVKVENVPLRPGHFAN